VRAAINATNVNRPRARSIRASATGKSMRTTRRSGRPTTPPSS
jgi:hypothetical protein